MILSLIQPTIPSGLNIKIVIARIPTMPNLNSAVISNEIGMPVANRAPTIGPKILVVPPIRLQNMILNGFRDRNYITFSFFIVPQTIKFVLELVDYVALSRIYP